MTIIHIKTGAYVAPSNAKEIKNFSEKGKEFNSAGKLIIKSKNNEAIYKAVKKYQQPIPLFQRILRIFLGVVIICVSFGCLRKKKFVKELLSSKRNILLIEKINKKQTGKTVFKPTPRTVNEKNSKLCMSPAALQWQFSLYLNREDLVSFESTCKHLLKVLKKSPRWNDFALEVMSSYEKRQICFKSDGIMKVPSNFDARAFSKLGKWYSKSEKLLINNVEDEITKQSWDNEEPPATMLEKIGLRKRSVIFDQFKLAGMIGALFNFSPICAYPPRSRDIEKYAIEAMDQKPSNFKGYEFVQLKKPGKEQVVKVQCDAIDFLLECTSKKSEIRKLIQLYRKRKPTDIPEYHRFKRYQPPRVTNGELADGLEKFLNRIQLKLKFLPKA